MKLITATLITLSMATLAGAYEQPGNPDRFISIGFNVNDADLDGTGYEVDKPGTFLALTERGPLQSDRYSIGLDLRIPMTRSLTFNFSFDSVETESVYSRQASDGTTVHRVTSRQEGQQYGFGARLYFNK